MVDENKVKLMTKLAIYEKNEGKRSINMSKYYRNDYVRLNALKTWVATTFVYWLIVGCYVFMQFDDLLVKVNEIDYFEVMYKLLGGYVVVCLVYFLFASLLYNYRYFKIKDGLIEYNSNLKDLIELQGGPLHRGKIVAKSQAKLDNADNREVKHSSSEQASSKKTTVNRTEVMRQRMALEEQKKQQEIIRNVEQRNARIAAKNEAALRQQQQMEADRQRIKERRAQFEREQMERIRAEREQQMTRVNYTYSNSGKEQ